MERKGFDRCSVKSVRIALSNLYPSMTEKKSFSGDKKAITVENDARNKQVCYSCFVLKRDKAVSFCSAGPLSADNKPRTAGMLSV